jgi:hypothetical protein
VVENLNGRIGFEHGSRTVKNYNENAFLAMVPYANVSPTGAPGGATAYGTMVANGLNGWGPNSGFSPAASNAALAYFFPGNNAMSNAYYANENRISELPGLRQYNMADRIQDKFKTAINWQASEEWALQAGVKAHKDDYANSVYGLKESSGWSLNLDASYQASEDLSVTGFYTLEDQHAKSAGNTYSPNSSATAVNTNFTAVSGGCYSTIATRNANFKTDPCNNWTADLHDQIDTLGLAFSAKGLLAGKLQLNGDVSVTHAVTDTVFGGGNYVNNPLAVGSAPVSTIAAFYIPATSLPKVTTKTFDLHLTANYAVDKMRTVRVGYLYSYLYSQDWAYEGMQAGGLTQMLPSYEQNANYAVHAIAVSYVLRFR